MLTVRRPLFLFFDRTMCSLSARRQSTETKSARGYQVGGTFVLQFLTIRASPATISSFGTHALSSTVFNNNVWYIKLALLIASLAILYFTAVVDIILAMSVISSIDQRIK